MFVSEIFFCVYYWFIWAQVFKTIILWEIYKYYKL